MENKIVDADGVCLNNGDRVYTHELTGERIYGTLEENDYKKVSDWAVAYDDGETCAVLDFKKIWKA